MNQVYLELNKFLLDIKYINWSTLFLLGTDWQWKRLNILQRMGPEEGVKVLNEIFSLKNGLSFLITICFHQPHFKCNTPIPTPETHSVAH